MTQAQALSRQLLNALVEHDNDVEIREALEALVENADNKDLLGLTAEDFINFTIQKVEQARAERLTSTKSISGNSMDGIYFKKKDYTLQPWNTQKIRTAILASDERVVNHITEEQMIQVLILVENKVLEMPSNVISYKDVHAIVEQTLMEVCPEVGESYKSYRSYSVKFSNILNNIFKKSAELMFLGDKSNSNANSALASTISCIMADYLGKEMYLLQFLNAEERQAFEDGFIYIHDAGKRYTYSFNCCLFNIKDMLKGIRRDAHGEVIEVRNGFEMANVWYNTPKNLKSCFSVLGDIVLAAASQQYGGFTIPEIDNILEEYCEKTYRIYYEKYYQQAEDAVKLAGAEVTVEIQQKLSEKADADAVRDVENDLMQGFQGLEYKFNTVASSRGDYPFVTVTGGTSTSRWGKLTWKCALINHMGGQGKPGFKKATMFPKYVFLYDENIHGPGKECEDVFKVGIECSQKTMYPDWLSLSGEGYISETYKKYRKAISPMGCRAFLSPYWKNGGMKPADENDEPFYIGRFNIGAISLHLPLIYQEAKTTGQTFYSLLDKYLEMIRQIHCRTYNFIAKMPASRNPLAFCEGGLYGGNLRYDQKIGDNPDILQAATASFGITALNELNVLATGKSISEDNTFCVETMQYINDRIEEFKAEDNHLYAIYGTPAESLCGRQIEQFRSMFGIIPGVSDREYVSNSFHCPVWEDLDPFQKQDKEKAFWELFNGGKIQYVKYPVEYNKEAYVSNVRRAMSYGYYEGCNTSITYCDDCGKQSFNIAGDKCPHCGSTNLTNIDRMNGYLSYSRVKGDTRLNRAKMAEIAERVSM